MQPIQNNSFFYREVPVDYDGTGTITDIKGNTLVWNQKHQITSGSKSFDGGNITATSDGQSIRIVSNGANATVDGVSLMSGFYTSFLSNNINGHKIYVKPLHSNISGVTQKLYVSDSSSWSGSQGIIPNSALSTTNIFTIDSSKTYYYWYLKIEANTTCDFTVYPQIFDLTAMGLDNLTLAEVEEWFSNYYPLPYYDYTTGKLLSFKGESLKTVGKNLAPITLNGIKTLNTTGTWNNNVYSLNGITFEVQVENSLVTGILVNGTASANATLFLTGDTNFTKYTLGNLEMNGCPSGGSISTYVLRIGGYGLEPAYVDTGSGTGVANYNYSGPLRINIYTGTVMENKLFKPFVFYSSSGFEAYEPYTSSILNLPTLTYFSSGMKSAGSVYDEITESKAITRVGSVDLGSLTWTKYDTVSGTLFRASLPTTVYYNSLYIVPNFVCARYATTSASARTNKTISQAQSGVACVDIIDNDYSDENTFKTAMSNQYLYYELATPTEITIDPPLDLTYSIWDDGTEQLLPENTSAPTTTPILCDIDYRTMIPVNAEDDPDGAGVITGTGNYRYHSTATLTATPTDEIYRFLRWEDENGTTVSFSSTYNFEVGE